MHPSKNSRDQVLNARNAELGVSTQVYEPTLHATTPKWRLGAKRLEPHLLRRQRCPNAPGWLHLDYFRVATIWPEQLQENIRKPTELICPVIRRHQVVGIVPPSIM